MGREKQDSHWEIAFWLPGRLGVLGDAGCQPAGAHRSLWPETAQNADMEARRAWEHSMGRSKSWVLTQLGYQLAYPLGLRFPHLKDGDEDPQPYLFSGRW